MTLKRPPYETSTGDGEGPRPSIGGGAANERGDAAQPLRLRRPCQHTDEMHPYGHYVEHELHFEWPNFEICPGGEFLPEDAELVERINAAVYASVNDWITDYSKLGPVMLDVLAASQVGEPG